MSHLPRLRPKIIRKEKGNCCDWCKAVVGTYDYPDVPKDVYRRNRYCRCTVEYDPGDGKRRDVHTKKWVDPDKEGKIEVRKRKAENIKSLNREEDAEQYRRYVDVLGRDKMPVSVSEFQNLKYKNLEEYEKLKDHVHIQSKFNSGEWLDKLNMDKQARHIQATAKEGKSYFFDGVNVEELYNKYRQTGKLRKIKGVGTNFELIDFNNQVPEGVDAYSGNKINGMTIHYGKTGAHLIPTYHERKER